MIQEKYGKSDKNTQISVDCSSFLPSSPHFCRRIFWRQWNAVIWCVLLRQKKIWHPRYLVSPPLYSTATTTSNTDINVTSEPLRVLSGSIWSRLGKHCHQRVAELWTDMFLPSSQTPLPVVLDSLRRELNMAKSVAFLERFEVLESIMTEVSFCSFWHQDGYRGRSRHKKWCKPVWTFFCTSRREGNLSRFHP
jgi:hypothetical protein